MQNTTQLKLRINGQLLLLKVKSSLTLKQLVEYLKEQKIIPNQIGDQAITIKTYYGGILNINSKLTEVPQRKDVYEIAISYTEESKRYLSALVPQNISYSPASQQVFKSACISLIEDDLEGSRQKLIKLAQERKISKELFMVLLEVKRKMGMNSTADAEIDVINEIVEQIKEEKVFKQLLQRHKQKLIKSYENLQRLYASMYGKQNSNKLPCLLYKAKTFEVETFKDRLNQCNNLLISQIQKYTKKTVDEVRSVYFDNEAKEQNRDFVAEMLEKPNFLWLFSTFLEKQPTICHIFGIYSQENIPRTERKQKSSKGFFFSLTQNSVFFPKQRQFLWVSSNIQLVIGDNLLTMSKSNRNEYLTMRKKKQLSKYFDMKSIKDSDVFGTDAKDLKLKTFQILTIHFAN